MGSQRRFTKEFKNSVVQQFDSSSPAVIYREHNIHLNMLQRWKKEYGTFEEAYANIKYFINLVYNEKRFHSRIGYKPLAEFEAEVLNKSAPQLTINLREFTPLIDF